MTKGIKAIQRHHGFKSFKQTRDIDVKCAATIHLWNRGGNITEGIFLMFELLDRAETLSWGNGILKEICKY